MKRRELGLLAGTNMLGLMAGGKKAFADSPAALLTTTLTPAGGERAGNAAGTIPAWTGGMTEIPSGFNWDPIQTLPPDFFASDEMLYEVNASNLSQYAHLVSDGGQNLITSKGFSLQVYPTHRTAAAPQWVYDNIASNAGNAQAEPGGIRLGFSNAYGGVPFPIPDSDPMVAGGQIIWNHQTRWQAEYFTQFVGAYTVPSGEVTLVQASSAYYEYPYYKKDGNLSTYDGFIFKLASKQFEPSTLAGGEIASWSSSNPLKVPNQTWTLLAGQGRVRKSPEASYDTPSSYADGIVNYDEYYGFNGAMDRYDWKLIEKKEMLIPYNNNKIFQTNSEAACLSNFFDPKVLRWELHRVWVVEATLHPGERNVLAKRRFYVDEDTWQIGVVDAWDGNGNIVRHSYLPNAVFPNVPTVIQSNLIAYNPQTGNYITNQGSYGNPPYNRAWVFTPIPPDIFDPSEMAAAASY